MRAAPAVDAELGSGRTERMLIMGLHAAAGAAWGVWVANHAAIGAVAWLAGLQWPAGLVGAVVLGTVGRWWARRALPEGPARLCWDGAAWQCRTDRLVPLRRVVVALDLGSWMLLHVVPTDGSQPRWLVASAAGVGAAWHGLRVALRAHAGDPARTGDGSADADARDPGVRP
jgi:hypothetical protein